MGYIRVNHVRIIRDDTTINNGMWDIQGPHGEYAGSMFCNKGDYKKPNWSFIISSARTKDFTEKEAEFIDSNDREELFIIAQQEWIETFKKGGLWLT